MTAMVVPSTSATWGGGSLRDLVVVLRVGVGENKGFGAVWKEREEEEEERKAEKAIVVGDSPASE